MARFEIKDNTVTALTGCPACGGTDWTLTGLYGYPHRGDFRCDCGHEFAAHNIEMCCGVCGEWHHEDAAHFCEDDRIGAVGAVGSPRQLKWKLRSLLRGYGMSVVPGAISRSVREVVRSSGRYLITVREDGVKVALPDGRWGLVAIRK